MKNVERNCERCLKCSHRSAYGCEMLAQTDVENINKCILEYPEIKSIQEDTLDHFIFYNNPVEYLSYIGSKDEDGLQVGDRVITLRGGFGTCLTGKQLEVIDVDDVQFTLKDRKGDLYCVETCNWFLSLFKIKED